jgi:prolyl-tRNA synthetase
VRGGYEIDEEKFTKVLGCKSVALASAEIVKRITKAEVGYAGPLNLPKEVTIIYDESTDNRLNFECGANQTHYHTTNVNWGRDLAKPEKFYDIKVAKPGDLFPETGEEYQTFKACEVGNIFPLNTKFSQAFEYTYADENGQLQPVYMGCYGIGTSRLMGVLVEKFADDKGLVWPKQVAPFAVQLISLPGGETQAEKIYTELTKQRIEVLWDDRTESAGIKFSDSDLLGIPVRLVVSKKTGDQVEWKLRQDNKAELISLDEVITRLKSL